MYRLIWVFAGHTGLIVGFVVRRLICLLHISSREFSFYPEYSDLDTRVKSVDPDKILKEQYEHGLHCLSINQQF